MILSQYFRHFTMESRFLVIQYLLILILSQRSEIVAQFNKRQSDYKWSEVDEWSSCSVSCGTGRQENKFVCLKMGIYSEMIVPNDQCKSLTQPIPSIRTCNMGNCDKVYFWRPTEWGVCSQTCGNAGRRTRDIECLYNEGIHKFELSNDEYCDQAFRPQASSACNLIDCPPVFVTGNWKRCVISQKCQPGKQIRSLDCLSLLKTGIRKKYSQIACYSKSFPPSSWRKCYDHINTKECLKPNEQVPEIETRNNTFFQMRKMKKLKIYIGQRAFVLLFARIRLVCPVNYFVPKDIIWKHKSNVYKSDGKSNNGIRVDEKGHLRIRKFQMENQGSWLCVAGPTNATTVITCRNPSVGYYDWVLRSALWNREMLNEDPRTGVVRQEMIQWIIGPWSACSVSCGGEGIQSREVNCEEIETRHYNIMIGEDCNKRGQKKPEMKRTCLRASQCPKWIFSDYDMIKCTDKCTRIGVAEIKGKLSCIYQEKEIDETSCDITTKPQLGCANENCSVVWKISKWSQCSLSCGGTGIIARYLECVWKNSAMPAGGLCYQQHLPIPRTIRTCTAPKCNLKCIDLSKICYRQEKFCKLSLYSYTCCSTCKKVRQQFRMQMNETKFHSLNNQKNNRTTKPKSLKAETMRAKTMRNHKRRRNILYRI